MTYYRLGKILRLEGEVQLPGSKSISNRALIVDALTGGGCSLSGLSDSDDTQTLFEALKSKSEHIDVGMAGTAYRFLTAYLACKGERATILQGSLRMHKRPIGILVEALQQLGASITYIEKKNFPPLKISPRVLKGGVVELDAGVSSQYLSALLMIAPLLQGGLVLKLQGVHRSVPYVQMTLNLMSHFGVEAQFENNLIVVKEQPYRPGSLKIERDWSSAVYWYQLVALCPDGSLLLHGLSADSWQGDSRVGDIFSNLGVNTVFEKSGARLIHNKEVTVDYLELDCRAFPDLVQSLVVCCVLKHIAFRFSGLETLYIKETDRVAALKHEVLKLGAVLHEPQHGVIFWDGERVPRQKSLNINTYGDHRMAMAFACVGACHPVSIENPEVVSKSYPSFWEELARVVHL